MLTGIGVLELMSNNTFPQCRETDAISAALPLCQLECSLPLWLFFASSLISEMIEAATVKSSYLQSADGEEKHVVG